MSDFQPGILAPIPALCRYLEFRLAPDGDAAAGLEALRGNPADAGAVIGLGPGLVQSPGRSIERLHPFPALGGPGCDVPSTQADLWCWLRGNDRGTLLHAGRAFARATASDFQCDRVVDGFKYDGGLDLSGYEDGTENPTGDDALEAAFVRGMGAGLDGSSFVAVQQWVHGLDCLEAMTQTERDDVIGRHQADNEEFDEAPASAHVKRTAQESFQPEAFVLRRSMPWADGPDQGLMFVAFGNSLDPFEAQLRRMTGKEDGVVDGLFQFTRPVSGSYFWCPPVAAGVLDLTALGL